MCDACVLIFYAHACEPPIWLPDYAICSSLEGLYRNVALRYVTLLSVAHQLSWSLAVQFTGLVWKCVLVYCAITGTSRMDFLNEFLSGNDDDDA
jgi:hypothetical protein